jgi:hypothetical protein
MSKGRKRKGQEWSQVCVEEQLTLSLTQVDRTRSACIDMAS